MATSRDYLLVVPVPHYALGDSTAATESAFALHLRMFKDSLRESFDTITVAGPAMSPGQFEHVAAAWSPLRADADGIRFVCLYSASYSTLRRSLATPAIAWQLWKLTKTTRVVHTGLSELFTPMEFIALVLGWLRRRVLVFVADIDWHESARMNLVTKTWSRGAYLRRVHIHDRWKSLQTRLARRFVDVVMLKGRDLVKQFGGGAPNVHLILDSAHSRDMLITKAELLDRFTRRDQLDGQFKLVYFGRLTRYKGIAHMLHAVAGARRLGMGVTFDIFGSGEQDDELRALTTELDLNGAARFNGPRPYGLNFLRELSDFDLMLAAPLSEDTPRSAIDAQARGIPVLAYDTYYYRDLVAEGAGVVCTPWNDIDGMTRKIVELNADPAELQRLTHLAVRFATLNTQEFWLARRAEWTLAACRKRA